MTQSAELERYAALLKEAEQIHGVSLARDAWRRLRRNPVAVVSLVFLIVISLLAFLTPILPLQSPYAVDTSISFSSPMARPLFVETIKVDKSGSAEAAAAADWINKQFGDINGFNRALVKLRVQLFGKWSLNSLLGRDELGRDLLARLFWGARVSLIVGLVATLVSLVIGVSYGAIAGYFGGSIDNIMMRLVDVLYSIPFIFLVIFLVTILGEDSTKVAWLGGMTVKDWLEVHGIDRITIFFVVVGAIYWLTMARVVRGQVISLKHEQFVEAARTIGAGRWRIIFRHLVPNVFSIVIVYLTLTIPQVMLFEAFLSFLGLGVQAPAVSWGLLANQGFRVISPLKIYWWLFVFPSLALGLTLFSLNFLGDGLRDALDPRLKNK
ncbi:MAG TPA: ABC transporter permease [Pirellulales bacterium]|jgi:oligopeptide transport system permease protein|nr:ABC transporter permease [Pirellulales bacterium]